MTFLYQILSIILSPFIDLYLTYRIFCKKEDIARIKERCLGYSKIKRPEGFLIWIHAASVGESKSAITLAKALTEKYSYTNILITSGTVTSAAEISKNLPERIFHQFIPVDKFFSVKRFLKHWQPNLAMMVESELWPNLILQTNKSGCPLVLVNGRISYKSYKRWKLLHKFGFNLLKNFTICFAQSQIDQEKFLNLGIKNVEFVGNLKAAGSILEVDHQELKNLIQSTQGRTLWLASSTHKGEEQIIIQTHLQLRVYFPNLITIIAPRHSNRLPEILQIIPEDLKVAIRSKNEPIQNCEIYLADTMGELGIFYSLSKVSLICGSLLDKIGGHNPFEALQLGSVILSGTYVANFEEIYRDLSKSKLCLMIKNQEQLSETLIQLLEYQTYYNNLSEETKKFTSQNSQITNNILSKIEHLL